MTIRLTDAQQIKLEATTTRPVNIIRWEHSGTIELISCSGNIIFNGENYTGGGANIASIKDGRNATLSTPATKARIAELLAGNWRNGICQIYAIPSVPADGTSYALGEGLLQLDGMIATSRLSGGEITVTALHRYSQGNTPRNTIGEVASHIPPPGTILTWAGDQIVLEARR